MIGFKTMFFEADELAKVMADKRAQDLFIGGVVDFKEEIIHLYRGDLSKLIIPLCWFESRPKAIPDFKAFMVTDFGQTVQFGNYEVSSDAILYEFDTNAQQRMKIREDS
jgi:hypothetical protein